MTEINILPSPTTPADFEFISLTGNNFIDGILWGRKLSSEASGSSVYISYSFADKNSIFSASSYAASFSEPKQGLRHLNSSEANLVEEALTGISDLINIEFQHVYETPQTVGTIRIAWTDYDRPSNSAWAYLPAASASAADIWLNNQVLNPDRADLFFKSLLIHEIGHTLGLKHPTENGDTSVHLDSAYDSVEYSVMSYNPSVSVEDATATDLWPQSLMSLDIAALHYLYGENISNKEGNNTYHFQTWERHYETIWDSGGRDTLSFTGSADLSIDLTPGNWSHIGTRIHYWDKNGKLLSEVKKETLHLTHDTQIENVTADNGHDYILGNSASNIISSGSGHDTVHGASGSDQLYGGSGSDFLTGGADSDVISGAHGHDHLYAGNNDLSADQISGGAGNDKIGGGEGDDLLIGGGISGVSPFKDPSISANDEGNDTLYGGAGNDTLIGSGWHNIGGDNVSFDLGEQTVLDDEENHLWAGEGDDLLIGSGGADQLGGCKGEDTILAESGNDTLWGGSGNDTLSGGQGSDTFIFEHNHGQDQITDFELQHDTLDLSAPELSFLNQSNLLASSTNETISGVSGLLITTSETNSIFLVNLSTDDTSSLAIAFSPPSA